MSSAKGKKRKKVNKQSKVKQKLSTDAVEQWQSQGGKARLLRTTVGRKGRSWTCTQFRVDCYFWFNLRQTDVGRVNDRDPLWTSAFLSDDLDM
jgi:hypothetical protein